MFYESFAWIPKEKQIHYFLKYQYQLKHFLYVGAGRSHAQIKILYNEEVLEQLKLALYFKHTQNKVHEQLIAIARFADHETETTRTHQQRDGGEGSARADCAAGAECAAAGGAGAGGRPR